jgi:cystathionine gamma-synthase
LKKNKLKDRTRAIQASLGHDIKSNPVSNSITLSSIFIRNKNGSYDGDFGYSRASNPNRKILERAIAELEYGKEAIAFASGMAAITAVFQTLKPGDHCIIPNDVYFNVTLLQEDILTDWGWEFTRVDASDPANVEQAIQPNTRLIWLESPSNPLLKITDIQAVCKMVEDKNIVVAVDNTWPSPVLMNPLELGADISVHSTTKYFGGHSDVLGGCVVLKEKGALAEKIRNIQIICGAIPAPFDCWLVTRGIQTLPLRMGAQTENAQKLAEFLNGHPEIEDVYYPGLESHPGHEVAKKQMKNGFGAMISVLIKKGEQAAKDVVHRLGLFTPASSLGGVESLVEHRRSVEGDRSTAPPNLVRISVGIEDSEDLINDWKQALENL